LDIYNQNKLDDMKKSAPKMWHNLTTSLTKVMDDKERNKPGPIELAALSLRVEKIRMRPAFRRGGGTIEDRGVKYNCSGRRPQSW